MTKEQVLSYFKELCHQINISPDLLPTVGENISYGYNIIIDKFGFTLEFYDYYNKSVEYFLDFKHLTFKVFGNITYDMACKWEANNRKENEDFRIQLFSKHLEYMTKLFGEEMARPIKFRYNNLLMGIYQFP